MAAGTLGEEAKAALIPTLREGHEEPTAIALSLAAAYTAGAKLDWGTFFKDTGAKAVPLPTYPFQRKRYWLNATSGAGDLVRPVLPPPEHPFLSASLEDPGEGSPSPVASPCRPTLGWRTTLFSAARSCRVPPFSSWPRAGAEAGCELLEELVLQAPLLIPDTGGVALQVALSAAGEDGKREVSIHSRAEAGRRGAGGVDPARSGSSLRSGA